MSNNVKLFSLLATASTNFFSQFYCTVEKFNFDKIKGEGDKCQIIQRGSHVKHSDNNIHTNIGIGTLKSHSFTTDENDDLILNFL